MKQSEYLKELEISLESKLSPAEVKDILSDYESFFTAGREEGKSDDRISGELGSPAYLAKILIDEHCGDGSHSATDKESGNRPGMAAKLEANPGRRLCAYLMDSVIAVLPALILSIVLAANAFPAYIMFMLSPSPVIGAFVFSSYSTYTNVNNEIQMGSNLMEVNNDVVNKDVVNNDVVSTYVYRKGLDGQWTSSKPGKGTIAFAVFSLAFYLLYSTICTFLLKGQTIGKKIMRIKVRRNSMEPVTGGTIFIREFLGKILLNSIPVVAIVSLFTILLTKDHRALHDMLADTVVTES